MAARSKLFQIFGNGIIPYVKGNRQNNCGFAIKFL